MNESLDATGAEDFRVYLECSEGHKRVTIVEMIALKTGGWVEGGEHPAGQSFGPGRSATTGVSGQGVTWRRDENGTQNPIRRRDAETTHLRSEYECPRCRMRVVVRGERFAEILSKLKMAGVGSLSLSGLGAILRGS